MDAIKELKYFFLVLFILAIVWLFTGGPFRPEATSGLFLKDPQGRRARDVQKGVNKITDTTRPDEDDTVEPKDDDVKEIPKDIVTLKRANARDTDINDEYIEIVAAKGNKNAVNISEWKIEGENGLDLKLGYGTYVYTPGISNPKENIFLEPGGKAIITTGYSPLGANFLINKCSGYLDQNKQFSPRLSRQCPLMEDEILPEGLNDECLDFIEDISKCEILDTIPSYLNSACQSFLSEKVNYKSCVSLHRNDADFFGNEWRIFLSRSNELWKKSRERITLTGENGNLIDSIAY
ncbi:MAG: hypothetical protein Q8Q21_01520 [bacterium]|nr:hypothetical protein [bacterium]